MEPINASSRDGFCSCRQAFFASAQNTNLSRSSLVSRLSSLVTHRRNLQANDFGLPYEYKTLQRVPDDTLRAAPPVIMIVAIRHQNFNLLRLQSSPFSQPCAGLESYTGT
ncbi:uncharacterized protein UV8b_00752 [Ustilaginoidea virens]|uniref:Uncharacterized protein n=1 Tax=Ustilaginoidea virens TaxID=1159556 RepID=A0A8E5HJC0_USTVR|nr:uncharacterized protein UV8b_00752 [Ustilaginoidea virens]QUC16511.1 hypothetical protein UV8b_00752 [Ustilaginoidea virens]